MREWQMGLLEQDLVGISTFLDHFEPSANGEERVVQSNPTGDLVYVQNFPLPDGFDPDFVDVLMLTHRYPDAPPIGLYLLEQNNSDVIGQLSNKFNLLRRGFHDAPTVPGYRWICFVYADNHWSFDRRHVASGDNLRKFLINFYHQCAQGK